MSRRYLGIIPARGGSKRIRGKNLVALGGRPLLAHTIDAARAARRLTAVVVSTDSPEIARFAARQGVETQGLRPAALARDASPVTGAIRHALGRYERAHAPVDAVVLLQPTSPFRSGWHIDQAIALFEARRADTVTSVRLVSDHPWWTWSKRGAAMVPWHGYRRMECQRADLPVAYVENGAVFVIRRDVAVRGRIYGPRVVPLVMDELESIDIDTPLDLAWAGYVRRRLPRPARRRSRQARRAPRK